MSSFAFRFLTRQLRRDRRTPGPAHLAHLRVGHTYARLAAGFKVGTTTAYRHVTEAVDLLTALAPARTDAVRTTSAKTYLLPDPSADRCGHHRPLPGAVHDIRAAREHGIVDALAEAGIRCWADKGYRDAGGTVRIPYWGRWATLSAGQQTVNRSHARI
ncbi:transposase family protein, partial [Streptomyces sp. TX20-6-3]|uniref:transposase family protein n=1 Tax=Streptomyces sp. TX20-6-3 TaxID=3028705 RepID=UPI0029BD4BEF